MYNLGFRDGARGLHMSCTSKEYIDGWIAGRLKRAQEMLNLWIDESNIDAWIEKFIIPEWDMDPI